MKQSFDKPTEHLLIPLNLALQTAIATLFFYALHHYMVINGDAYAISYYNFSTSEHQFLYAQKTLLYALVGFFLLLFNFLIFFRRKKYLLLIITITNLAYLFVFFTC